MPATDLATARIIARESAAVMEESAKAIGAAADALREGRGGLDVDALSALSDELVAEAERLRRI